MVVEVEVVELVVVVVEVEVEVQVVVEVEVEVEVVELVVVVVEVEVEVEAVELVVVVVEVEVEVVEVEVEVVDYGIGMALIAMLLVAPPTARSPTGVPLAFIWENIHPILNTAHATEDINGTIQRVLFGNLGHQLWEHTVDDSVVGTNRMLHHQWAILHRLLPGITSNNTEILKKMSK